TRDEGACSLRSSGGRVSNTEATCPSAGDNCGKPWLIPDKPFLRREGSWKTVSAVADGWACGALAGWWGNGAARRRCVAELGGRSAALGLRRGPASYGRQPEGRFRNGR